MKTLNVTLGSISTTLNNFIGLIKNGLSIQDFERLFPKEVTLKRLLQLYWNDYPALTIPEIMSMSWGPDTNSLVEVFKFLNHFDWLDGKEKILLDKCIISNLPYELYMIPEIANISGNSIPSAAIKMTCATNTGTAWYYLLIDPEAPEVKKKSMYEAYRYLYPCMVNFKIDEILDLTRQGEVINWMVSDDPSFKIPANKYLEKPKYFTTDEILSKLSFES